MRLFQLPEYPRRVYIDAEEGEIDKLSLAVSRRFEVDPSDEGDINGLFFVCSDTKKVYFPRGILNVIKSIADANQVVITEMDLVDVQPDIDAGTLIHEDMLSGITLRDYQLEGTHAGLYHKQGLLQMPTGCLTGDTKVRLLDGSVRTMEELATSGLEEFWVISCDKDGHIRPGKASHPRLTKVSDRITVVTLDDGTSIRCTPDHRFLLRSGVYKEADHLTEGDSLMPLCMQRSDLCTDSWIIFNPATESHEPLPLQGTEGLDLELGETWYTIICCNVNSVETLSLQEPVYDLEVEEYHNFAVETQEGSGVFVHNSGKTEVMSAVTRYLLDNKEGNILIGVPSTNLLVQTHERLLDRGIEPESVSMLGGGHGFKGTRVVVSTVQTAYNRLKTKDEEFMEWSSDLRGLLLDESHHSGARTWYYIIDSVASEYLLGFSAEPFYNDQDHIIKDLLLRGAMGSVLYRIPLQVLIQRGYLSQPYVFAVKTDYNGNIKNLTSWHTINKVGLVQNTKRNELIVEVCQYLIDIGKNPLVLVQQVQHGRDLALLMSKGGHRVAVLTGGQSVAIFDDGRCVEEFTDPEETAKRDFSQGKIDALLGTSVMDEGVDMPSLASVVLAGGGKSKLKLIQRIGRGLRPKPGDNTTFIVDFMDGFNRITHNQFRERKSNFDKNQIPVYFVNNMDAFKYLVSQIRQQI